jgi:hypothetical protein
MRYSSILLSELEVTALRHPRLIRVFYSSPLSPARPNERPLQSLFALRICKRQRSQLPSALAQLRPPRRGGCSSRSRICERLWGAKKVALGAFLVGSYWQPAGSGGSRSSPVVLVLPPSTSLSFALSSLLTSNRFFLPSSCWPSSALDAAANSATASPGAHLVRKNPNAKAKNGGCRWKLEPSC